MPKLAANLTFLFTELAFLDRFEAAAKAGFEGVEFLYPYAHPADVIAEAARAAGLQVVLFNTDRGDWDAGDRGLTSVPGREADARANIERALEYALEIGCGQIHVLAGLVPAGAEPADCEATFVENLHWAVEMMAPHGVHPLIEPLNSRDVPGYFLSTNAHATRIIEQVGADRIGLQMDLYHTQIMEGDLAERIKAHIAIIRHLQIANPPGRNEPGAGEVDFPYLFDLIDRMGYEGWIGLEYHPTAETMAGLAWAKPYGIG
jgi:hydroxypyruvate isomerase